MHWPLVFIKQLPLSVTVSVKPVVKTVSEVPMVVKYETVVTVNCCERTARGARRPSRMTNKRFIRRRGDEGTKRRRWFKPADTHTHTRQL